ncbi:MAG: hypothetical protein ACK5NF_04615 [Bacilli bacterium]
MKIFRILFIFTLLFTSCENGEDKIINDKLINGYSLPVEGGIQSAYIKNDENIIYIFNIKHNNLFSICSGKVNKINNGRVEINCKSKEKIIYFNIKNIVVNEGDKLKAGEKFAELENASSSDSARYNVNIIFYKDKDNLDESLTYHEFEKYIVNEKG